MNVRNVRFGSTLESTMPADSSSPLVSTTPVAWPFRVTIRATEVSVRISTPASRAALAIAFEIAPVPPRAKPHDRNAPSISPM